MATETEYAKLDTEELAKRLEDRGVILTVGSGKDGKVLKSDLIQALEEEDTAERQSESAPEPTVAAADELRDTFPVERLIADAYDLLGCASHVAAGALHGQEGTLSIEQGKAAVQDFLNREVK